MYFIVHAAFVRIKLMMMMIIIKIILKKQCACLVCSNLLEDCSTEIQTSVC